jgi:hypothetical protein
MMNVLLPHHRFLVSCLFIVTGTFLFLSADRISAQEKPQVPEQLKRLHSIVGKFEGVAAGKWAGQPFKGKVTHINSISADGFAVSEEEAMELEGMGMYRAVGMFGFDASVNMLHLYTVSNFNDVHDHIGTWTDQKSFSLQYSGIREGKPIAEQIIATLVSKDEYRFKVFEYCGGEQTFFMEVTMKRVK